MGAGTSVVPWPPPQLGCEEQGFGNGLVPVKACGRGAGG